MGRRYDITIKKRTRGPAQKPDCTVEIESAYCEQFIERLKDAVHYSNRCYDPETKLWYVRPEYFEKIVEVARECDFDEIITVEGLETKYIRRDTSQPSIFDMERTEQ